MTVDDDESCTTVDPDPVDPDPVDPDPVDPDPVDPDPVDPDPDDPTPVTTTITTTITTPTPGVAVSKEMLEIPEGSSATYTIKLETTPSQDVTITVTAGGDLTVKGPRRGRCRGVGNHAGLQQYLGANGHCDGGAGR